MNNELVQKEPWKSSGNGDEPFLKPIDAIQQVWREEWSAMYVVTDTPLRTSTHGTWHGLAEVDITSWRPAYQRQATINPEVEDGAKNRR